eukprot:1891416-Alexandrium_andersonii.AAC.1
MPCSRKDCNNFVAAIYVHSSMHSYVAASGAWTHRLAADSSNPREGSSHCSHHVQPNFLAMLIPEHKHATASIAT